MSKITSAIDAKSLVIGVLLTVIVFMSMGAGFGRYTIGAQRLTGFPGSANCPGVPFAIHNGQIYYYK